MTKRNEPTIEPIIMANGWVKDNVVTISWLAASLREHSTWEQRRAMHEHLCGCANDPRREKPLKQRSKSHLANLLLPPQDFGAWHDKIAQLTVEQFDYVFKVNHNILILKEAETGMADVQELEALFKETWTPAMTAFYEDHKP
jgi:hypothetical protein